MQNRDEEYQRGGDRPSHADSDRPLQGVQPVGGMNSDADIGGLTGGGEVIDSSREDTDDYGRQADMDPMGGNISDLLDITGGDAGQPVHSSDYLVDDVTPGQQDPGERPNTSGVTNTGGLGTARPNREND